MFRVAWRACYRLIVFSAMSVWMSAKTYDLSTGELFITDVSIATNQMNGLTVYNNTLLCTLLLVNAPLL